MTRLSKNSLLLSSLLLLFMAPLAASAWWNEEWGFRKKIQVESGALPDELGAEAVDMVVPIRLHSGNFGFFMDTMEDGADLRFIAADDKTPLSHQIEHYDLISGIGVAWVHLPSIGTKSEPRQLWMYYGNSRAAAAIANPHDSAQKLVLHFAERSGAPRDSGPIGQPALLSTAVPGAPGVIDAAVVLDGAQGISFQNDGLTIDGASGYTVSSWLRIAEGSAPGLVFRHGTGRRTLKIETTTGQLRASVQGDSASASVSAAVVANRWYHFAATADGNELKIYLDGQQVGTTPATMPRLDGRIAIGAVDGQPGFAGSVDEIQVSGKARSANWLKAQFLTQSPDASVLVIGEDESSSGSGLGAKYLQLLSVTIDKMSLDGWVIIGLTILLGFVSIDVIVAKAVVLARTEGADRAFLQTYRAHGQQLMVDILLKRHGQSRADELAKTHRHSALFALFRAAGEQMSALIHNGEHIDNQRLLAPQTIDSVRASLDVELVEQTSRLNARMVWMTLAVSGAPFLGLLGTVVGVMITFTSVAASGDVNVATIAPGVASAMATTVVGLIVAIPSLLAYNYLATQVGRITAMMEVFSEQLIDSLLLFVANVRAQTEHPQKAPYHAA